MNQVVISCLLVLLACLAGCHGSSESASWALSNEETKSWLRQGVHFENGVMNAYKHHQLVAIGDVQWNNRIMAEVNTLISQRGFLDQVKQVVVEFGNSRHQKAIDDYLTGRSDNDQVIDDARRDTLFFINWLPDDYRTFFLNIRRYNLSVSESDRVKVWLAESPFFWEETSKREQWKQAVYHKTDGFLNAVMQAMATNEKVFMIFAASHLINLPAVIDGPLPLATYLKQAYPNQVYTIWPITEPEINQVVSSLTVPSVLPTNTRQGAELKMADLFPTARIRLKHSDQNDVSVGQLVDGLLYVGESQRITKFSKSIMQDEKWLTEMAVRLKVIGGSQLSAYQEILANSQ